MTFALDNVHFTAFCHTCQTSSQAGNHAFFVAAQHVDVEFRLGVFDAVGSQVAHFINNGSVVQQGFGRDTADVQANAAQGFVTLNDGNFQTFIGCGKCSRVTARTATQHDHAVLSIGRTAESRGLRCRSGSFRGFLRRGSRRFGFRSGSCAFGFNDYNQAAFGDFIADFDFDFFDHARNFGRHIHRRFVGFQGNQGIINGDSVAYVHFNRNNIYIFVPTNVGHFQFN